MSVIASQITSLRRRSKKTSKLRVAGLCARNSSVIGEFPPQRPVTRKMFPFDDVLMFVLDFSKQYMPLVVCYKRPSVPWGIARNLPQWASSTPKSVFDIAHRTGRAAANKEWHRISDTSGTPLTNMD